MENTEKNESMENTGNTENTENTGSMDNTGLSAAETEKLKYMGRIGQTFIYLIKLFIHSLIVVDIHIPRNRLVFRNNGLSSDHLYA